MFLHTVGYHARNSIYITYFIYTWGKLRKFCFAKRPYWLTWERTGHSAATRHILLHCKIGLTDCLMFTMLLLLVVTVLPSPRNSIRFSLTLPFSLNLCFNPMQTQQQSDFSLAHVSVWDLRDVVLGSLGGSEGHRSHGHHDRRACRVYGGIRGLRGRSNWRAVACNGGPLRLHLSPLEKLGEMKASGTVRYRRTHPQLMHNKLKYNNFLYLRSDSFICRGYF